MIRENNGKREFGRIDITKPDVFNSPYYYLQQNDMVLVDMRKQKLLGQEQTALRGVSLLLSIITTVSLVFRLFN